MNNCFVTKLPVVSDNKDLLKLGECRVSMECANDKEILISLNKALYYCEQAHTLGDISVAANEQKTVETWKEIYGVKAGIYTFHFLDKYSIAGLLLKKQHSSNGLSFLTSCSQFMVNSTDGFSIETLKEFENLKLLWIYGNVSGDIANLKGLTALTSLFLGGNVSGDIANLKGLTALTSLFLGGNVSGDIANLKGLTALTSLSLVGNVSGDIASLKGLTALTSLSATYGDKITLKAADFSEMPNLRSINIGTGGTPYTGKFGDAATLSPELIYLFLGGNSATIEWTVRPSTSKIIGILGSPKLSNIDKMLQDQAQCVTGITSSTPEYVKTITATGTRTSASDAAVQTLQSKGYTVSITPA